MGISNLIALLSGVALFLFGMTLMGDGLKKVAGIILRMFCKHQTKRHVGDILLGFAVLMFGMQAMSSSVAPLQESETFLGLLTTFSNPILGILVGLVFTCVLQSASAAVGILQALAATGVITFSVAYPLVMGIAVGAAMPVLLSSLGANVNGKRTAFVYLLIDVLGAVIWGVLFYGANALLHFSFLDMTMSAVSIAFLNTLFRFATVLILTPFIGMLEQQICRLFRDTEPAGPEKEDFARLEARFIEHPAVAIEQCRQALCNMALEAKANLEDAYYLIGNYQEKQFQFIAQREDIIDKYEDKLGSYLIKLTGKELSEQQNKDVTKFLHAIGDVERIGDHAMNIAECAKEIAEKNIVFSEEATRELNTMFAAVQEITYNAITAFTTGDLELAYRIEPLEELIDSLCDEMKLHHVDRLQRGICQLTQGFVFNDLLTNYERVADHCSNLAVAMIELESDSFDTHEYLISLKKVRSHSFDQYYEDYRKKFSLPEV